VFESIWPRFPGYLDAVKEGWLPTLSDVDPFRVLDFKFRNRSKSMKKQSQKFVGSIHLQLAVAKEVILKLEQAQETWQLSPKEVEFKMELKAKWLGLASLTRVIARQRSRIMFLREGDANT
jgi:hypothetical protein